MRLYRTYGAFRNDDDIVCNAHIPDDAELGWWVPCVFDYSDTSSKGTIWGYLSAKYPDRQCWFSLPDTRFGPYWTETGHWEASEKTWRTAMDLGERPEDLRRLQAAKNDPRSYPKCRHSAQSWYRDTETGDYRCEDCEETNR